MMHKNQYLIDMCIVEGCTVLDDTCKECGTPDDWIEQMPQLGYNSVEYKPHKDSHRDAQTSGGLGNCVGGAITMNNTTPQLSQTKKCTKCGATKSRDEFNLARGKKDGLVVWCRPCQAEYNRAWRAANPERKAKAVRAWHEANREKVAEYHARSRDKYPDRYAARKEVTKAVMRGDIRPARDFTCACGTQAEHYHHHLGYAPEHRLDVMAVCVPCHIELHKDEL